MTQVRLYSQTLTRIEPIPWRVSSVASHFSSPQRSPIQLCKGSRGPGIQWALNVYSALCLRPANDPESQAPSSPVFQQRHQMIGEKQNLLVVSQYHRGKLEEGLSSCMQWKWFSNGLIKRDIYFLICGTRVSHMLELTRTSSIIPRLLWARMFSKAAVLHWEQFGFAGDIFGVATPGRSYLTYIG